MQASVGDCNTACPKSKKSQSKNEWAAWKKKKGTKKDDAKRQYIRLVRELRKIAPTPNKPLNAAFVKELDDLFKQARKDATSMRKLHEYDRRELYGFRMQATVGDCNTDCPKSEKEEEKWYKWNEHRGMSKEDAKIRFIRLVNDCWKLYYD